MSSTILFLLLIAIKCLGICSIKFAFDPGVEKDFYGFLWKGANRVHLSPRLQASTSIKDEKLCGLEIIKDNKNELPFNVKVIDSQYGFADIHVNPQIEQSFWTLKTVRFTIKANGCLDGKITNSDMATVTVQLIDRHGPIFDRPSYRFTVSYQSPAGSVVGKVQAIEENPTPESDVLERAALAICNYRLTPDTVPFTVDKYGIIRVSGQLPQRRTSGPYTFKIIAEDCFRPVPRTSSVDIFVEQTMQDCQPGWKGLPTGIEYRGSADRPEKLFPASQKIRLDTCSTTTCSSPSLLVRLDLKSALRSGSLETANPQACLHSPEYLHKQRIICELHETTMTNLLPNPRRDLASQLVAPNIGNPPRSTPPTMSWYFNAAFSSIWQVDPTILGGGVADEKNTFDTDFSLTFWIRRKPLKDQVPPGSDAEDQEETVICSQDEERQGWRFFSVSFRGCHLIVRLVAALHPRRSDIRQLSIWEFDRLPDTVCNGQSSWHHYAISFSKESRYETYQRVGLLLDGQDLEEAGSAVVRRSSLRPEYNPSAGLAKPRVTIGGCYDTANRWSRQHLNAELAGLTLLTGRTEAPNKLYCLPHCGETLLIPNVLQDLSSDTSVGMASGSITIRGNESAHVAKLLSDVVYSRPQPNISPDFSPNVVQSRLIHLSTDYTCSEDKNIPILPLDIRMNVIPLAKPTSPRDVVLSSKLSDFNDSSSASKDGSQPSVNIRQKVLETMRDESYLERPPSIVPVGSDVIIVDPSIADTGIPLFPDIQFQLPEDVSQSTAKSSETAASSVPIDNCLIWVRSSGDPDTPVSTPNLNKNLDEYFEWPVGKVVEFGMTGKSDQHGVILQGHHPAGDYAHLLQYFVYWPPKVYRAIARAPQASSKSGVLYVATIALVCALDSGRQKTMPFYTKVVIQSANSTDEPMQGDQPQPLPQNSVYHASSKEAHYSLSDRELRKPSSWKEGNMQLNLENYVPSLKSSQDIHTVGNEGSSNATGLLIGGGVFVLLVLMIVAALLLVKRRAAGVRHLPVSNSRRRRTFHSQPADFGGGSLKRNPVFNVVPNPFMELEQKSLEQIRQDELGSNFSLHPQYCIYSPPMARGSFRNINLGAAELASLEEFTEDNPELFQETDADVHYTGEVDSSHCVDYVDEGEGDLLEYGAAGSNALITDPGEQTGERYGLYNEEYVEWMDDDVVPGGPECPMLNSSGDHYTHPGQDEPIKWDIAAETGFSKKGSPVVEL